MSHPFLVSRTSEKRAKIAIDLLDYKVVELVDTRTRDMFGGMFCDEPGLGKTITMLALILRTKGLFSENSRTNLEIQADADTSSNLRSAPLKDRSIPLQDLVISGASLIIVPDPLVDHWKYQIEVHVAQKALRTFIDENNEDLPSNSKLATYDVVVTSFSRLTKEWRLHRPASVLEKRMPERYGFENTQRYTDGTVRGEASSLLTVHWVRVIVDEGHKLGVQKPTNLMQMARLISAKRRWVMTGTPTPNTLQSADLRFMHGLLVFLRTKPYGEPDGRAWTKAIARPFEQNDPVGFYRLQSLLSRIMIRHTKESIREILPKPIRHTVFIDPTPSEYAQYNVVAAAVRANLVITSMDPHVPGKLHPDSLLNPINRKDAVTVVTNLRFACCGGVSTEIVLSTKAQLETINMLVELEVDSENIAIVTGYLHRVTLPGMTTMCGCCKRELQLLMIVPCGHLCCADCVEDRFLKIGPSCFHCNEVYDPEVFQELQPGFDFCEVDVTKKTKPNSIQNKNRSHQQSGECDCGQMERQGNVVPELVVDASKIYYAANRVRELKKEYARRDIDHESQQSCPARNVKVIIFSQFTEIIWRTKLAFKQQNIATADFITLVNPKARMKALKRFRTDPSLNVLLLSEMGSHGLDLSFVTHVYLMEEVWDKSLEQQVISRAHRMGAQREVYVEKLWMRGSVESEMARIHELDESEETPPRITHDLGPPVRTRKRQRKENKRLLNVAGTKRQKRNRRGDAKKVPTGNKSSFLQRKLDYVLNLLRMVDSSVVAQTRQVRFRVVDEKSNVTIREAVHMMPEYVPRVITSSSARQKLNPRAKLAPREKEKLSKELSVRAVTNDQAVKSKRDSLASKDKHSPWAAAATSTRTPALIGAIITSNLATTPTTNPLSNIHVTKRTSPLNISLSTSTDLTQRPTVNKSTSRNSGAEDIIEIDDDSSPTQPYVQLSGTINVSPKKAKPEVIVIESDSSINCDADNEDNSSNDDSESDSEKVLLSRLVKVAKSYFARRTGTSPSAVNTSGPAQKAVSTLYLDDDETETE
ncbi:hypothetical protein PsorP6_004618 [Peronosclerospora sorghi]|uniref:Uncharacterized protein n=1 Tax=Peronosclerospora sorghi TaxID=230839 RepID=A0ACC0VKH3_9STRA|nr:hypothetical protein PsorP6_004618 [Peronosclerospora sorghi]